MAAACRSVEEWLIVRSVAFVIPKRISEGSPEAIQPLLYALRAEVTAAWGFAVGCEEAVGDAPLLHSSRAHCASSRRTSSFTSVFLCLSKLLFLYAVDFLMSMSIGDVK